MLTINGVTVTLPKTMSVDIEDLDSENTTRNTSGDLMRDRIAVKRKINLDWPPLKQAEISAILNAVAGVSFTVSYLDPMVGARTGTFYAGSKSAPLLRLKDGQPLWENLKFNLIEL